MASQIYLVLGPLYPSPISASFHQTALKHQDLSLLQLLKCHGATVMLCLYIHQDVDQNHQSVPVHVFSVNHLCVS